MVKKLGQSINVNSGRLVTSLSLFSISISLSLVYQKFQEFVFEEEKIIKEDFKNRENMNNPVSKLFIKTKIN